MNLDWSFIVESMQGEIIGTFSMNYRGISTDSRTVAPGELYIALKGDCFDGHVFAHDAVTHGAAGVVVRKGACTNVYPRIEVNDPLTALQRLSGNVRKMVTIPVIGITGSHGKTTTKDLLSSILSQSWKTRSTFQNLNGLIGVPVTLMQLEEDDQALVIEIGISKPGEMGILAPLAQPTGAIFTCIAPAHSEFMPTLNDIAHEKLELAKWVSPGGFLFLNADDPVLMSACNHSNTLLFGLKNGMFRATIRESNADGCLFTVSEPCEKAVDLFLPYHGKHNVYNALGAITAARTLGISYEEVQKGLNSLILSPHRSQIIHYPKLTIIDDAYNAAPSSMRCALQMLADYPCSGCRIAVLGDMLELGMRSYAEHESLGRRLGSYSIDIFLLFGNEMKTTHREAVALGTQSFYFEDTQHATEKLQELLSGNDVVLIKASRSMHAEKIVDFLKSLT
jgi:UDP-N-acetylmuramoyl-tripeptide--D-alanyl-D-alanine ligase